ncbi:MAG: nucleoside deaminase [Alphaproteobacteria bacterium]
MDKLLKTAYKEAQKAFEKDEVPVGAVVVKDGKVIAKAHNKCEHTNNATFHAEMIAINKACKKLKQNRLWDCDLYVTLEPCMMCAAAISFVRIKNLYIGCEDKKGGGLSFYEMNTCHHKPQIENLNNKECSQILKDFFKNKRKMKE